MKILIVSYFFYPENMPRSFRTFELAKGFSTKNHEVDVYIPDYDYDYSKLSKRYNIKIIRVNTGFFLNKNRKKNINNKKEANFKKKFFLKSLLQKILFYFFGEIKFEYAYEIFKALKKDKNVYDLILSISYPIYVHYGVALALKKNKDLGRVKIADCGDPFYYHQKKKIAFYFRYFEKWIFKYFDYISVPSESVIDTYLPFKDKSKIKVIPQGFELNNIKLSPYKKNNIPIFGYAGAFIENQRDPKILFEYLIKVKTDFKFLIFLTKPELSMKLIDKYIDSLGNKLIIKSNINRENVLFELSKCDFLINVENLTSNQVPSKLIDYALTKRPILSFHPERFNENIFNDFLNGNYDSAVNINLEDYDIKKIIDDFLKLINNN